MHKFHHLWPLNVSHSTTVLGGRKGHQPTTHQAHLSHTYSLQSPIDAIGVPSPHGRRDLGASQRFLDFMEPSSIPLVVGTDISLTTGPKYLCSKNIDSQNLSVNIKPSDSTLKRVHLESTHHRLRIGVRAHVCMSMLHMSIISSTAHTT